MPIKTVPKRRSMPKASIEHQISVGQTLVESVEGHAARTDSPEFVSARATLQRIISSLKPNPFGDGPIQAHHGDSIWVKGAAGNDWHLVLNWAGIEWSAQFCCDPAKVERLRQNAEAITAGFPDTIPSLQKLGYTDTAILSTPITDAGGIARYVDSIWNACVPIPQPRHTGALKPADPLACGVHTYPEPMCGIPRVMRDDFVPFVVDSATKTAVVVAPVAPRHSGDGRVRVLHAEKGNPLHAIHQRAHTRGAAVILGPNDPTARRAFAKQQ
jgi:Family of unknown function (DUF6424)